MKQIEALMEEDVTANQTFPSTFHPVWLVPESYCDGPVLVLFQLFCGTERSVLLVSVWPGCR